MSRPSSHLHENFFVHERDACHAAVCAAENGHGHVVAYLLTEGMPIPEVVEGWVQDQYPGERGDTQLRGPIAIEPPVYEFIMAVHRDVTAREYWDGLGEWADQFDEKPGPEETRAKKAEGPTQWTAILEDDD